MAKLYFRYGAMGSSKSANILMVRYNYEERGQYAVLLKPRTDNRDGEHEIKSRIGLEAPAEYVDEFLKEISETWSADVIEEVPTVCWCGKRAQCNTRYANGKIVREGAQIFLGSNESYVALCRKHYKEGKLWKEDE